MVHNEECGVGDGDSRPRLVVTHRLARSVYLTSAVNTGSFKQPSTGIFGNDFAAELTKQGLPASEVNKRVIARDIELSNEVESVSYVVMAIEAATGKVLWQQEAHQGKPPGGRHRKNTYASETPGHGWRAAVCVVWRQRRVVLLFAGRQALWKKSWAPQPMYLDFGTASSPLVHNGRVYQLHDSEGESFLTRSMQRPAGSVDVAAHRIRGAAEIRLGHAVHLAAPAADGESSPSARA
jgi:hypothetical protein